MAKEHDHKDRPSALDKWLKRKSSPKVEAKVGETGSPPLSFGQARLHLLQQLFPSNPFYHYSERYQIRGPLNTEKLRSSILQVIEAHPSLRTTFREEDGNVVQHISPHAKLDWAEHTLVSEQEQDKLLLDSARKPFDLTSGPLIRVVLVSTASDRFAMAVTCHHIVTDKWSMRIFREDLSAFYSGATNLVSGSEKSYASFAREQRKGRGFKAQLEYWKNKLTGAPAALDLPYDKQRPVTPSFRGGFAEGELSEQLSKRIRSLATEHGTTVYVVLLSAFQALLHRYSDQDDLTVGSPFTDRDGTSLERVIGFFNNTVVLRSKCNAETSFNDMIKASKVTVLEAFANRTVPYEQVVKAIGGQRSLASNPLFQVMFLFNSEIDHFRLEGGIDTSYSTFDLGVSKFDLTLYCEDNGDRITTTFEYAIDLFTPETIRSMSGAFNSLLTSLCGVPDNPVGHQPLVDHSTRSLILNEWSAGASVDISHSSVVHALVHHSSANPDHPAVDDGENLLTYQQLDQRSNQLAIRLLNSGVQRGAALGLLIDRSVEMLVGIFGILKAGACYVPLDPSYPKDRLLYIIEDSDTGIVVTTSVYQNFFDPSGRNVVFIDQGLESLEFEFRAEVELDDPAYIIYTSGSSGKPKGVAVTHRQLLHSTGARSAYYDSRPERYLLMSSFSFDSSIAGIFWPVYSGGTLILPPERVEQDMPGLGELIARQDITHTLMLPGLYSLLLQFASAGDLSSLNTVIVAGEACSADVVERHFKTASHIRLFNEYGPTEATVWCTVYELQPGDSGSRVPIGKPIPGMRAYVLDPQGEILPQGMRGQLCVAGAGVTNGYLNRDEDSKRVFVSDPFQSGDHRMYFTGDLVRYRPDGNIEFLGRIDSQVKVRGYRIEPEEIAAVMRQHTTIRDAYVFVDADQAGHHDGSLIAYYVGDEYLKQAELQNHLKSSLPDYMIPSRYMSVESIARLPNGKVDVMNLPVLTDRASNDRVLVEPTNEVETTLVQIWHDVLGANAVSITDNFFDIGGDSILSIQILSRARNAGLVLSANDIFEYQTIQLLAMRAKEALPEKDVESTIGEYVLGPIQQWFFDTHRVSPSHWNLMYRVHLKGNVESDLVRQSFVALSKRYPALQAAFPTRDGRRTGIIDDHFDHDSQFEISTERDISERLKLAQEGFSIETGGLFKGVFNRDTNALYLVAHHLVVDAVSWMILIEELDSIISDLTSARALSAAALIRWYSGLDGMKDQIVADKVGFWNDQLSGISRLPVDRISEKPKTEANASTLKVTLDTELSKRLRFDTSVAYNTRQDEIVLSGLVLALHRRMHVPNVTLMLELHGREEYGALKAPDGLVGWLTSMFPMKIDISQSPAIGPVIIAVKETMRSVPDGGISYGLFRQSQGFHNAEQDVDVLFNYLGVSEEFGDRFKNIAAGTLVLDGARAPESERQSLIECNAGYENGELSIKMTYSTLHFDELTIRALLDEMRTAFMDIVDHCTSVEKSTHTPSDFPEAGLSQDDLDHLFDTL